MTKCSKIRIQVSVLRINGPLVIICSESFILIVYIKILAYVINKVFFSAVKVENCIIKKDTFINM